MSGRYHDDEVGQDGRGVCRAGSRCYFAREVQALHQHGFCASCCPKICDPGLCEDCTWIDTQTGEPFDWDDA